MSNQLPKPIILHDHIMAMGQLPMAHNVRRAEQGQSVDTWLARLSHDQRLLFRQLLSYRKQGQQSFVVGPRLQQMFRATSLEGIPIDEFPLPFDTFYVALPGCDWSVWGGATQWHQITGAMVSLEDGKLSIYLWGMENEHARVPGDDASFWMSFALDEMREQGLDIESYALQAFHDPEQVRGFRTPEHTTFGLDEHWRVRALEGSSYNPEATPIMQQNALNVLRVVMNMALYIASVDPDITEDPDRQKARLEREKLQGDIKRLKKQKKDRKKNARRRRQISDLQGRVNKLSPATVVWIGRTIEKTYLRTRQPGGAGRRHHWVRGHWRPKVISTVTLRGQAELAYQAARDRVWELRQRITDDPSDIDMVAYAAELEQAARELGEASRALAEAETTREAVNAMPRIQPTSEQKRRWIQPYERNRDNEEKVEAHVYKM